MDLKMPRIDGVEATRAVMARDPELRVIALTSFKEEQLIQDALDAGAIGYLLKDVDADGLAKAICAAHRGEPTLAPEAAWMLFKARRRGSELGDDLKEREREVLALIVEGQTNPEIANHLIISESTVKTHVSNILAKLGVSTRTEATSLAVRKGLI
jgi:NarL family two-component system response regulator LiaR